MYHDIYSNEKKVIYHRQLDIEVNMALRQVQCEVEGDTGCIALK